MSSMLAFHGVHSLLRLAPPEMRGVDPLRVNEKLAVGLRPQRLAGDRFPGDAVGDPLADVVGAGGAELLGFPPHGVVAGAAAVAAWDDPGERHRAPAQHLAPRLPDHLPDVREAAAAHRAGEEFPMDSPQDAQRHGERALALALVPVPLRQGPRREPELAAARRAVEVPLHLDQVVPVPLPDLRRVVEDDHRGALHLRRPPEDVAEALPVRLRRLAARYDPFAEVGAVGVEQLGDRRGVVPVPEGVHVHLEHGARFSQEFMDERPELGDHPEEPHSEQAPAPIISGALREPVGFLVVGEVGESGGVDERVVQVHDEDQLPRAEEARQVGARRLRRKQDRVVADGVKGNSGGRVVFVGVGACSAPSSRILRVIVVFLFPAPSE